MFFSLHGRSLFREATGIVEGQQEVAKETKRAALDKAKAEDESTKLRKVGGVFWHGAWGHSCRCLLLVVLRTVGAAAAVASVCAICDYCLC